MSYKLKILIISMTLVFASAYAVTLFAGVTNDLINRETKRKEEIVKKVLKEKNDFAGYKKLSSEKIKNYQKVIASIKKQHRKKLKNSQLNSFVKPAPQAVVFISLSMPDLSLNQIIQDAEHYQIPVVIRGLYKNSFKDTAKKIFDLVKEKNKGGILINPRWFKEYGIEAVPALVVNNAYGDVNETIGHKRDVVYGNVPIKRALSIVAERGENSDIASSILNKNSK